MSENYVSVNHLPRKKHRGKIAIDWKNSINEQINFKYKNTIGILTIIDYKTKPDSIVQVKYENYYFWISTTRLLGCSIGFVNNVIFQRPDLVNFFVNINDAINNNYSSAKVCEMKCDKCGTIMKKKITHLHFNGICCKKCGDGISYPEKFMYSILSQLNLDFNTQKKVIIDNNKRFYDFVLENEKIIIEMDGGFHYEDNCGFNLDINKINQIDKLKDEWAINNEYKIIRIESTISNPNYLKENILSSELNKLLDLSNIDWDKVSIESEKSIMLEVCEYRKNKPNKFSSEIANKFNLSITTITKYLKRGNDLGLCEYNPIEEQQRQYQSISKPILVLKGNIVIKEYSSIEQCVKQSIEDFNIKFRDTSIRNICKNRTKNNLHKGYTFKYK